MYKISKSVSQRISSGIKNYQSIIQSAIARDINEKDTVTIVIDILSDLFGYNKYSEITGEYQIRSTYCDLATMVNGKVNLLIEVKSVGIELKPIHTKQAVDYAANQGIDWVILTNAVKWEVYKVNFTKPIDQELVYSFNFLELSTKLSKDIELLFPLTKEGTVKSSLNLYHDQRQALSRYTITATILSEDFLNILKRTLRKMSPGINIDNNEISEVLTNEIIKREVLENDQLKESIKKVNKLNSKANRPNKTSEIRNTSEQKGNISQLLITGKFNE
ncbi:MAG: type I restriction enzyme HsdR N-terminal domain-containing protein [Bacteroidetes bacterium]|nr:type I restriction enzyme HsdR N-terminal domain-containing protein [Bacteroidota bacterium]